MKKILVILLIIATALVLAEQTGFSKKLTLPSERAVYHNNRGVKFLSAGDLELAEIEFKTAAELSPDYIEAYNNLGIVAKKRGDLRSAKAYFEKAVELDKTYGAALSHLSMVYLDEGNLDKALDYGRLATQRGSTMPLTHYNLAIVYLAKNRETPKKDFSGFAEKELKISTELNPQMYEAHLALARLYRDEGRYELATIRYRLALENHPDDKDAWTELGEVYKLMGDTAKAENALRQAMAISKEAADTGNPHMQLGLTYLTRREYSKAIEELKKALEADPKNEIAHFRLGTAYLNMGETKAAEGNRKDANRYFKSALAPLSKAISLNPQISDAAYNLGLAYYRLGNTASAEGKWRETLAIDPKHARALYNMAILMRGEGDKQKAIEYFCKFIAVAGQEFAAEKTNALNIVKTDGEKCQN